MEKTIEVTSEHVDERLDKFLIEHLPLISRSQIQKLIKAEKIMVNDKKVTPHCFLKEGDIVTISNNQETCLPDRQARNKTEEQIKAGEKFKLKIIADTDDYIVLNKPSGIAVHKSGNIQTDTLADLIVEKYPKIKRVGEDPLRPGVVHRLDKDVSGLIVLAKTQKAFKNLKKQFQERTIEKKYVALVYDKIEKENDIITFPLERATSGHKIAALPLTKRGELNIEGREAITEFTVLGKYINYTLLEIKIKTGRTHQIRAHMAAYGHPIVGDNLYGTARTRVKNKKFNLGRVFLVATGLAFTDLEKQKQKFKTDLPKELKELLKIIK